MFCALEAEICKLTQDEYALRAIRLKEHRETMRNWHPDLYERFYGVQLQPGESYIRDEARRDPEFAKYIAATQPETARNP